MSITETIEFKQDNSRYLESIATALHQEAKNAEPGVIFKKVVPAMAFYCFALESKLISFGIEVFTESSEYKKFMNSTILGKFSWLFRRMRLDMESHRFLQISEIVERMSDFRNSLVHSKTTKSTEDRVLDEWEQLNENIIKLPVNEKDFMSKQSLEECDAFEKAFDFTQLTYLSLSRTFFNDYDFHRGSGFSRAKRLSPKLYTNSLIAFSSSMGNIVSSNILMMDDLYDARNFVESYIGLDWTEQNPHYVEIQKLHGLLDPSEIISKVSIIKIKEIIKNGRLVKV